MAHREKHRHAALLRRVEQGRRIKSDDDATWKAAKKEAAQAKRRATLAAKKEAAQRG